MIRLLLLDLDGTLIESFLEDVVCPACGGGRLGKGHHKCDQCRGRGRWTRLRPDGYDDVIWLPGRKERLREIGAAGVHLGICSNQTGVHYGFQTKAQVAAKMNRVGVEATLAGFGVRSWWALEPGPDRKPEPGLLKRAMEAYNVPAWQTLFVGDMESDRGAAERAGCGFAWAEAFFDGVPRDGDENALGL